MKQKQKQKQLNINLYMIVIILLIQLLIFQNIIQEHIVIIKYLDETLAVFLFFIYLINIIIKKKIKIREFILLNLFLIVVCIGLIANYKYNIQVFKIAVYSDIVSIFKFYFVYVGIKDISDKTYRKVKIKNIINVTTFLVKIYLLILSVFSLINIFININMHYEIRYGIRAFSFIYGTPGHIINQMTYILIILCIHKTIFPKKNNLIYIILSLIIIISTLRTRGFILVLVFLGLYYYLIFRKKKKIGFQILILLISVITLGFSQFKYYFFSGDKPRSRFVKGAIELVKEYFPLGTGFGTFGSSSATDYYSQLYYRFNFNLRYGMKPNEKLFLNDNYWPMIFAQIGFLGALIFILFLILFCKDVWNNFKNKGEICKLISLFYIFDIIFSSVQSSYLAHYSVVTLTFITTFLGSSIFNRGILDDN